MVNLFDTGEAAQQLGLPAGLKALLATLCGVESDKSNQLADWRRRPLTSAMMRYAQTDTHYLLYIFDRLRLLLARGDVTPQRRQHLEQQR